MPSFDWVDLVVAGVLLVSALLACLRGFIREILGLLAWGGAAFVAVNSGAYLEPLFAKVSSEPPIVSALALGTAFIIALLIFSLVAILLARVVRGSIFGSFDRFLGFFYGLVRGAVLVVAAYIVVGLGIHTDRWPPAVLQSASMGWAYEGAAWAVSLAPEEYRPQLQAPPQSPAEMGNGTNTHL